MQVITEISTGRFEDLLTESMVRRLDISLGAVIEDLMGEFAGGVEIPENVQVSISLLDEDEIRELNRNFLGDDLPTDVLSFPLHAGEMGFAVPAGLPLLLLGDIVICPPVASVNANASHHSFEREFSLLIIHGLLHLFGMDHDTVEKKEAMWRSQERYWDTIEQALSSLKGGREGNP